MKDILTTAEVKKQGSAAKVTFWLMILGALGIVYGDIGTSPLYAVNNIFFGHDHLAVNNTTVLSSISLILWAITIVVTLKYIVFVLLANKEGEGGVFALLGLLSTVKEKGKKNIGLMLLIALLILAAGLLLGEGIITPAISVLSAVEGLSLATNVFVPYIIPIAILVLIVLFAFQNKGTSKVGKVFGPIMVLWLITLAFIGIRQIVMNPGILIAISPFWAFKAAFTMHFKTLMVLLGSVVLTVTGVEALYADLGHFGLKPIRISWLAIVYPALILNYLGQGGFLLGSISGGPAVSDGNLFYSLVPHAFLFPLIILATAAAVIACQALISGAFSLVSQAVALHYIPRVRVVHTNKNKEGQIYVPLVNWFLFLGSVSLILSFKTSASLASAYGFAVSGVMFTTTLAMFSVAAFYWGWGWWKNIFIFGIFGLIDLVFLVANSFNFWRGGYVPVVFGLALFVVMVTWHWGREIILNAYDSYSERRKMTELINLKAKLRHNGGSVTDERGHFVEVDRVMIFLIHDPVASRDDMIPVIVRAHMKHHGSIPKHTILLNIQKEKRAYVRSDRYHIHDFGNNLYSVEVRLGFMEEINMENIIKYLKDGNHIPGLSYGKYIIQAGSEEFVADNLHAGLLTKFLTAFYGVIQSLAAPTYRYFGLSQDMSLSTTAIQINVSDDGGKIKMPELDLVV